MPQFTDFFAGAGLVRLALEPEWTCVWANDNDPRKYAAYTANFPADAFILGDVEQVTAAELPKNVDMAWASFPCQDLSLAGWRRGMSGKRSGTFWAFWRILSDLYDAGDRPPLIVIENVPGLLYGDNLNGLCEALSALEMQFGALVIDARQFLPQSRPRVFIVAVDQHVQCDSVIDMQPHDKPWFPKAVRNAYSQLPSPLVSNWRWWHLPVPQIAVLPIESMIEDYPTGVTWHTDGEINRLLGMMSPVHRNKINEARSRGGKSVGFLYKRTRKDGQRAEVRFDGIAGCLRTPGGGSSRQTIVVVENGAVRTRLLSPREAARLMGVDETFILPLKYNDAYRAMGDGVAVPVVSWLAEHLLSPLSSLASDSDKPVRGLSGNRRTISSRARNNTEARVARWSGSKG